MGRIKAHDLDIGKNADVEYTIVPGDGGAMFDITTNQHNQEGNIILKRVSRALAAGPTGGPGPSGCSGDAEKLTERDLIQLNRRENIMKPAPVGANGGKNTKKLTRKPHKQ